MRVPLPVTDGVVEAFPQCPHKAYLRLAGVAGQASDFVVLLQAFDAEPQSGDPGRVAPPP
ncbi:hypothetical protein [Limnoglobus roseus]|uniref:Uncharacterized protein n=1 Tax=Limnoglobus roseus TaxID=2598579 RepID=A0A5C1AE79_9BACT|nr:hypothetical protein [Limnoglobus roseus]QEL16326.1 hypothetical protein PX52LOC_03271 [Limnoglobus roseus]